MNADSLPVKRPAVFLDRDGVLNEAIVRDGLPYPPNNAEQLILVPGASECCRKLHSEGFFLCVVTNQPDIARAHVTWDEVNEIHTVLSKSIEVDEIRVCPHDDADQCSCRKPEPGLLISAALEHGLDLTKSFMIGDRWKDIEAGKRAGCRTVFIDYAYKEKKAENPDCIVSSFPEAVNWILARY